MEGDTISRHNRPPAESNSFASFCRSRDTEVRLVQMQARADRVALTGSRSAVVF